MLCPITMHVNFQAGHLPILSGFLETLRQLHIPLLTYSPILSALTLILHFSNYLFHSPFPSTFP